MIERIISSWNPLAPPVYQPTPECRQVNRYLPKPPSLIVLGMDLFSDSVPFHFVDDVFEFMLRNSEHRFAVITAHPDRLHEWFWSTNARHGDLLGHPGGGVAGDPPRHIWFGVTASNQHDVNNRVPQLLNMPVAIRFVLYDRPESEITLTRVLRERGSEWSFIDNPLSGFRAHKSGGGIGHKVDWVIAEGGRTPVHPRWLRQVRDECQKHGTPFCFIGWGDWAPEESIADDGSPFADSFRRNAQYQICERGERLFRVGAARAGRLLDGRIWDQYPEGE